jgi:uncharacterized protein (TIGR00645 family)
MRGRVERTLERGLFASRWLMAPFYLGLVGSLVILLVVFIRELVSALSRIGAMSSDQAILVVLTLVDLSLAGNLLLIVIFSGYENFVSKIDTGHNVDRPGWMGTVDFSGLKLKLIASIVAISGIHLLKSFMYIGKQPLDERQLFWLVIIHLSFVGSGVLLALMDFLSVRAKSAPYPE